MGCFSFPAQFFLISKSTSYHSSFAAQFFAHCCSYLYLFLRFLIFSLLIRITHAGEGQYTLHNFIKLPNSSLHTYMHKQNLKQHYFHSILSSPINTYIYLVTNYMFTTHHRPQKTPHPMRPVYDFSIQIEKKKRKKSVTRSHSIG